MESMFKNDCTINSSDVNYFKNIYTHCVYHTKILLIAHILPKKLSLTAVDGKLVSCIACWKYDASQHKMANNEIQYKDNIS